MAVNRRLLELRASMADQVVAILEGNPITPLTQPDPGRRMANLLMAHQFVCNELRADTEAPAKMRAALLECIRWFDLMEDASSNPEFLATMRRHRQMAIDAITF